MADRSTTARITVAARSPTGIARSVPPKAPIGVRNGATIAALRIGKMPPWCDLIIEPG
jgi:hypothetical protein